MTLVVASCATPALDRQLLRAEASSTSVTVKGPRGYLSRERGAAIVADLQRKAPQAGALERHAAIEEAISGSPLSTGNKVALLEDGAQTYAAMLAAIRSARRSVHLETYIFEADDTGREFAAALVERARAGVKVRVLYDWVGSIKTPKEFFKEMEDGGVEVAAFHPPGDAGKGKVDQLNQRDHRKLTIVDGRVGFLGGINISDVYGATSSGSRPVKEHAYGDMPVDKRPWRDMQSRVEGPAVADLQRSFLGEWAKARKEPEITDRAYYPQLDARGNDIVRVMAGSPADGQSNDVYVAIVSAIDNADKEVRIMNPYFVPHEELRRALREAARRGVAVSLILPGHSDSWLAYYAGRSYYEELLEAGVRIFERKNRILHAKSATVDGVWSTVGSTNLDWRSLLYNDELNVVVLGTEFAAQLNRVFDLDVANSGEVTRLDWQHRSLEDRAKEAAAKAWARLL